jgi:uncharacterized membrane protein YhaH (DUF805 family)
MPTLFFLRNRISRGEYWIAMLLLLVVEAVFLYSVLSLMFGTRWIDVLFNKGTFNGNIFLLLFNPVVLVVMVVVFYLTIAPIFLLLAKRLHDFNKSGSWGILAFTHIYVFVIVVIVCGIVQGTEGQNEYGPAPEELPCFVC